MDATWQLGRVGEDKAASYLEQKGYTVLDRNWHSGHLELDIVCRYLDLLVVVEVKTRLHPGESPEDLLGYRKREHLRKAANAYIRTHGLALEVRFDLILITGENLELHHIPDAVQVFE